ncbi:MAG TPA: gluconate 2-dehydrogenase subunit 3 family protein [Gemmatimonadaceae bacterium]|nr:gluconate 2-dehydrogenase subunit 3 family protein [Gemmatimonadaceae bacterium]
MSAGEGTGGSPGSGESGDGTFQSRYPGYDVLDRWSSPDWDDQTREVVRRRLEQVPPIRFFTPQEAALLSAIGERIIPQPDRAPDERVPIVPFIDERLHEDRRQGYRYEEIPPQREAWRAGLAGIDATSLSLHARAFLVLSGEEQDTVLRRIERGDPPGDPWDGLDARRFFTNVLCETIVKTYYAHPMAWNETGYSGPSSPRGHVRKWIGGVDPWEAHERPTLWKTS